MILVVGATGKLGLEVVRALEGRAVRAFARSAAELPASKEVDRVSGDVLDRDAVSRAVMGCFAVICLLGPGPSSPPMLCGEGTHHVIAAMQAHEVKRLVCVTGAIIGHPHEQLGLVYRLIESQVPAEALGDRRAQERMVMHSGLDWTLVRPTRLTDEPAAPSVRCVLSGPDPGEDFTVTMLAHVPRANVARFVVSALGDPETVGRAYTLAV